MAQGCRHHWDLHYWRAQALEIVRGRIPGPDGRCRERLAEICREFCELNYILDYKIVAKNGDWRAQERLRALNIRWDR